MTFLSDLPPEVLNEIIKHLDVVQDAKSLARIDRSHHRLFNDLVYIIDMELHGGTGAICAISKDLPTAVGKFLDLGWGIKFTPTLVKHSCLLHVAAYHGALSTVKLLLQRGANSQEQDKMGKIPLYYALKSRRGEVVKTLSDELSDITNTFIDYKKALTPLHGACMHKQPTAARLFLELGDDLHAKDIDGITPLLHTLHPSGCCISRRQDDGVFDTLVVLIEFGLDLNLVDWDFSGRTPVSSLELGTKHWDPRVKDLFSKKELLAPKFAKQGEIIGRTWLVATDDHSTVRRPSLALSRVISGPKMGSSAYASCMPLPMPITNKAEERLASFTANDFPKLDTTSSASLNIRQTSSIWNHAQLQEHLIWEMPVKPRVTPGNASNSDKGEPFPQLVPVAAPSPNQLNARDKWGMFRQAVVAKELGPSECHGSWRKTLPGKN